MPFPPARGILTGPTPTFSIPMKPILLPLATLALFLVSTAAPTVSEDSWFDELLERRDAAREANKDWRHYRPLPDLGMDDYTVSVFLRTEGDGPVFKLGRASTDSPEALPRTLEGDLDEVVILEGGPLYVDPFPVEER